MLDITNVSTKIFSKRNLQFLQDIKRFPVPNVDEELLLFEMAKNGDNDAKNKLFMGHQRFIYSLAKQFSYDGEDVLDYVNEGNIGMSIAFSKYDPSFGVRFITYASNYIRREMNAFYLKTNNIIQQTNKQKFKAKIKRIKETYFNEYGFYPSVDEIVYQLKEKYDINVKDKSDVYEVFINSININKDDENYNSDVAHSFDKKTLSYNSYEKDIDAEGIKHFIDEALKNVKKRDAEIIKMLYGIGYDREYSSEEIAYKYDVTTSNINTIKKKVIDELKKKIVYRNVV